ncbi:MAG: Pentapeptide repeats (8 copies) [Phormidesmis priestleyi Ana]|uniref:Pentapeptide repeats (8 copies) n=1 Tax=Phormidesmis priestleyi Ana TaxID=1666911 RepID=A0A0P8BNV8_9CYAN|nr:MAG: Pentapeptide repeats (8 copies) [Phormidesmis priestleyi Ana]
MELQAIREKLQQLQAEPPAAEALALPAPWSDPKNNAEPAPHAAGSQSIPVAHNPQFVQSLAYQQGSHSISPRPDQQLNNPRLNNPDQQINQSPQEKAIEALKQRSLGHDQAAIARMDHLVAQEIYRLEVQANNINERSRQQATEIMAIKRSAQQASVGLRRQGIHDHPQLTAIIQFLADHQSAAVPYIERDSQGHFTLAYDTIDFHQAEQEAIDTAHALRNRRQASHAVPISQPPHQALFTQPIASSAQHNTLTPPRNNYETAKSWIEAACNFAVEGTSELIHTFSSGSASDLTEKGKRRRRRRNTVTIEGDYPETNSLNHDEWPEGIEEGFGQAGLSAMGGFSMGSSDMGSSDMGSSDMGSSDMGSSDMAEGYLNHQFSWLDGTIWFSSAAIARIMIQAIAASYPIVQTLSLMGLVGVIVFALYKVIISKSTDYSLVYRLCIGMMGLFLAGLF